jgi:UDP-glucose 4-epimerase
LRVLITGGAGFVGSSLARELLYDGHEVFIIDNFSTGRDFNIEGINKEYVFDLDLTDAKSIPTVEHILEYVDICYHFAASIGVKLVQEKPKETFLNSTKINDNLFPLFEKFKTKVIFSSTSEVYGETKNKDGSKETDHLEIHPVQKPRGSYACSKLFSEFMLRSYNFQSVIVRFFNIVGPTQVPDYGHVLPRFIECAVNNMTVPVYGSGRQVRSFCDIRDAIQMLKLLILDFDLHNGEIYNIGNDSNVCDIGDLAKEVVQVTGSNSFIEHIGFEEALGKNFEEIYVRYPNTDKIKKYYQCKYTLKDIIKNIYETNFNRSSSS